MIKVLIILFLLTPLFSDAQHFIAFTRGKGGTITQATSKATAVTINKQCGNITTSNASLAAAAEVSFVVNNTTVSADDVVMVCIKSGGTVGSYLAGVTAVADGSFTVTISNVAASGSLSQALVLNFVVIKSVTQ